MKFKILVILLGATLLASLSSCVTNATTQYLQTRKDLPQYKKTAYQSYTLKPKDQVSLRVLTTNDDLAKLFGTASGTTNNNFVSYTIYRDSTIDLPFISHIKIGGKTLESAQVEIQRKLQEFDKNATVVLAMSNDVYYVIGESGKGQFPIYKDKMTIFQALAVAGDIKGNGDRSRVRIIRETSKGSLIKEFDIRSKSLVDSEFYYIYPNDIIYISTAPGSFFKAESFGSLMGLITSSITFFVLVLNTIK